MTWQRSSHKRKLRDTSENFKSFQKKWFSEICPIRSLMRNIHREERKQNIEKNRMIYRKKKLYVNENWPRGLANIHAWTANDFGKRNFASGSSCTDVIGTTSCDHLPSTKFKLTGTYGIYVNGTRPTTNLWVFAATMFIHHQRNSTNQLFITIPTSKSWNKKPPAERLPAKWKNQLSRHKNNTEKQIRRWKFQSIRR